MSKGFIAMILILARCNPFQIVNIIIAFDSVFVVDFFSLHRSKKSECDKSVYAAIGFYSIHTQSNVLIAPPIGCRF